MLSAEVRVTVTTNYGASVLVRVHNRRVLLRFAVTCFVNVPLYHLAYGITVLHAIILPFVFSGAFPPVMIVYVD